MAEKYTEHVYFTCTPEELTMLRDLSKYFRRSLVDTLRELIHLAHYEYKMGARGMVLPRYPMVVPSTPPWLIGDIEGDADLDPSLK